MKPDYYRWREFPAFIVGLVLYCWPLLAVIAFSIALAWWMK